MHSCSSDGPAGVCLFSLPCMVSHQVLSSFLNIPQKVKCLQCNGVSVWACSSRSDALCLILSDTLCLVRFSYVLWSGPQRANFRASSICRTKDLKHIVLQFTQRDAKDALIWKRENSFREVQFHLPDFPEAVMISWVVFQNLLQLLELGADKRV